MSQSQDNDLGMDRSITRRDFLDGVRVALTGSLVTCPWFEALALPGQYPKLQNAPGYYPPAAGGIRGSHPGSFEVAHGLRDGKDWEVGPDAETGEVYDLVVVGAGLAGLAAAYFFREAAGPRALILVLDNHDDFGGHCRRNEFYRGDRLMLTYGGTQSIDSPSTFSPEAKRLLQKIGIDLERFHTAFDQELYESLGLGQGVFFDKETFGTDRMVSRALLHGKSLRCCRYESKHPWREFSARAPFSEAARKDFVRLYEGEKDYMPGLTTEQKLERLQEISYRDFLADYVKVDPQLLAYFQKQTHVPSARGIDTIEAGRLRGYPGFQGMGLPSVSYGRSDPYIHHFPDGNASVARLLVRSLIPQAVPGSSMEDVVTARVDYGRLDKTDSPARIRLNSTVVRVRHLGEPGQSDEVEVTYVRGEKPFRVRGKACLLACFNTMIPYLCAEMPEEQKRALSYGVRRPLVYSMVLLRNWTSFHKLEVSWIYCPGNYYSDINLDFPVTLGEYRHSRSPEEPMVIRLFRAPCRPGLPVREQHRMGRWDLYQTSFETFEREIRDQLGRTLSAGGFDPARDIEAITVNRWPHGYAYGYSSLFDEDWTEEKRPNVVARRPFGRIFVASSDTAAIPLSQASFDEAHRAIQEIPGTS